jgi:hypothetical protein
VGTAGVTNGNILIADGVDYNSVGLDTAAGNHLDLADLRNTAYSSLTGEPTIPSAGDGLTDNSGDFDIKPLDFAGHGLEDDGSDTLRIDSADIGDGLDGGSGSDLAVDVSDFDGDGLTSSSSDLNVDSTVARTNQDETFNNQLTAEDTTGFGVGYTTGAAFEMGGSTRSPNGAGLAQSFRGATSDFRTYVQGGHGRVAQTWNASYDNSTGQWDSVIGSEPHALVGLGNTTPGGTNGGSVTLAAAPSNSSSGDKVNWNVGVHVETDGKVGIQETSPSGALDVDGDITASGEVEAFGSVSDERLKADLDPLESALDKVERLTGYGFDWHDEDAVHPRKRGETDVGVVAQEVEDVLPEAVNTFEGGHSEGYKSVSYDKLVPLLVEAINDLRNKIEE